MASLRELIMATPVTWKPEPDDAPAFLVGEILDIGQREGFGDAPPYQTFTVQDDEDGQFYIWHAMHTTARQQIEGLKVDGVRVHPRVGDSIAIRYNGTPLSKTGKKYHAWVVVLRPAERSAPVVGAHGLTDLETGEVESEFGSETFDGGWDDSNPFGKV
jgi:hypothetical protein